MNLTLKDYINWIESKKFSAEEVVNYYINKAEKEDKYNAYAFLHKDYVQKNLKNFSDKKLHAAPISIKDIIFTKNYKTTCASKILHNYIPPHSSTAFENLEKNWWLMIGKTNCDQFGMWGSNQNSIYWPCKNFYWTNRTSWWSSWWSAVSVAADLCIASLWTDTWWSIRQPASFNNIVWLKPTYWRVSRYWVNPLASSFDQIWTFTKTVEDAKILLESISWFDPKDSTSVDRNDYQQRNDALNNFEIKNKKIALPKEFFDEGLDEKIKNKILEIVKKLENLWAIIEYIDFPLLKYSVAMYYILQTAEASTNLARLDWIRYWLQYNTKDFENIKQYYKKIRTDWFLEETKRRILTWTFVLSSDNYEWYYLKAIKARKKLQLEFKKIFDKYDCIIWPTTPEVAWKLDSTDKKDPIQLYLADIYTTVSNLAQNCAISIPAWFVEDQNEQMPVWLQIIADSRREDVLFWFWNIIEKLNK